VKAKEECMDRLSKKRRSEIMSRIRSKDTAPEMAVRRLVHSLGYRYRLHSPKLPGKPDMVFTSRKKVIFVHGCFWHAHKGCPKGKLPKTNLKFWKPKLEKNQKRDKRNQRKLKVAGWKVLVIWQCKIKNIDKLHRAIVKFLEGE
jgi:DNA mismatch endonuclease (patch repair protein)